MTMLSAINHRQLSAPGVTTITPCDLLCPDGNVRAMESRRHCGFVESGHAATRALWWHDLVDWATVGIGPATWDWTERDAEWRCWLESPSGRQCVLPVGHVGYLHLPHRYQRSRRR